MKNGLLRELQELIGDAYEIERELGGGGMSHAFLAIERSLGRRVVIKVLPPDMVSGVSEARFKREILAAPASLKLGLQREVHGSGVRSFHTTSIEREPGSGHYVLVAGPERLLLETTPQGMVVASRRLGRQLHSQPEGVTFVGDSLLVIADEGSAVRGRATLTCFRRVR